MDKGFMIKGADLYPNESIVFINDV